MTHPEIAVYKRFGCPPPLPEFIAMFVSGGTLLPGVFEGATREAAMKSAHDWWAAERASVAKGRAARGMSAASAAPVEGLAHV